MSDYYSSGDKVRATEDTGGLLGSETRAGQSGTVLKPTMWGDHYEVKWDDGHVSEVSTDVIRSFS